MADVSQPASWFSRLRQGRERRQTDWGDFGTAYGLDLSLQAGAEQEAAAARAPAPKAAPRRWWQRARPGAGKLPR
jgi:hypothetical protein